jgi:hypothetical protein
MRKLNAPEINISIFGFLINFVWEIWQAPLFKSMDSLTHSEATLQCTLATLGDVVILLVAFWIIALITKSRRWIVHPKTIQVIGFIAIGVVITVVIEAIAIHVLNRWQYATVMPILPILGTGIAPILQWLIIPPIILSMMSRRGVGV